MDRGSDYTPFERIRVELSGRHIWLRLVLVVALVGLAAAAFSYGVGGMLKRGTGWQTIQGSDIQTSAVQELSLQYNVASGTQGKALTAEYSAAANRICKALDTEVYDGCNGLGYLNANPGKEVTVEEPLYRCLQTLENAECRYAFYAPVYEQYRAICSCDQDNDAKEFDPVSTPEIREYLRTACAFAADPEAVRVELKGENRVLLHVSAEYEAFARDNGQEHYLDLYWLRNAFAVDFIAEELMNAGYCDGVLSSFEGFTRTLGEGNYLQTLNGRDGAQIFGAGQAAYQGRQAVVCFRDYPLTRTDALFYYVFADGRIHSPFADEKTGLNVSAVPSLTLFAPGGSCAETALRGLPVYAADMLDEQALMQLEKEGISSLWISSSSVNCLGDAFTLQQ